MAFARRMPWVTIKHLDMKKIKIVLNAIAITIAIAGAIATRYCMQNNTSQYIPDNNTFKPAGEFGIDYNCYDSKNTCTFYRPDSVARPQEFLPSRSGQFVPVNK